MVHTKPAQESYVTAGLALALIARGVTTIEKDKVRFELACEGAWRHWSHASTFPAIARRTGPDAYYQVVDDHSRRLRYLPVAAFYDGDNGHRVAIRRSDDTLDDCIEELVSDSGVPWDDWQTLADDFISRYE
jgi:hypothetical protein